MTFCGIPIFFQEVATGQYLGSGGLTMIGQLVPMLQGVGYATMTIVFFLDIYYCIIIAWTLFYLIATFTALPDLPWGSCGKTLFNCIFIQFTNTFTSAFADKAKQSKKLFWLHISLMIIFRRKIWYVLLE